MTTTLAAPLLRRVAELLKNSGALSAEFQPRSLEDLKRARVSEEELARALAKVLRLPYIDPDQEPPDPSLAGEIPPHFLRQGKWLPHSQKDKVLVILTAEPYDQKGFLALRSVVRRPIQLAVAPPTKLRSHALRLLEKRYADKDEIAPIAQPTVEEEPAEPPTDLPKGAALKVDRILEEAVNYRATDIHFEMIDKERGRIRFRVDGKLHLFEEKTAEEMRQILTVIKVRSGLDTSLRPRPQDASFKFITADKRVLDLRVSIVPTVDGEEAVLRVLPGARGIPDLEELGLAPEIVEHLKELTGVPHGIFLVTGPTGSGKTTTLFAILKRLIEQKQPKILAVEDPVEYRLEGVTQVQVNKKAGLDFATALRAFLRQDPDVILVGEIRDAETAKTAVEAAMTGHLVLGTLHTNSAVLSVRRLNEMGIETFRIVDTLRGVLSQRLVPRLCPRCSLPDPEAKQILEMEFKIADAQPKRRRPGGCDYCHHLGYHGRVPLAELLWVTPGVRDALARKRTVREIEGIARREAKFRKLREDALRHVADGSISLADALEATHDI